MTRNLVSWVRRHQLIILISLAITAVYANHFHNSFHFDDSHAVVDNPSIRSLRNLPAFFLDASTFSVLPANRAWRPLVSLSLALDYQIGRGLEPVAFHASTFLWFLLLVWLVFLLAQRVFEPHSPNPALLAAFAAAWYGLHPVCAETVNYVIQRGDLYSTLGVVAGLYMYAAFPQKRRLGLYLLPVIAGLLSKPPAMIFPVLLFAWLRWVEDRPVRPALLDCLPSVGVVVAFTVLLRAMTPPTFNAGALSPYLYRITQPYIAFRYFASFFLPLHLSADTDQRPFESAADPLAISGFVFLALVAAAAYFCCRRRELRPAGFGLLWFLVALAPTSLFPLAEVENDHRMFFPFIGLAIATVWTLGLAFRRGLKPSLAVGSAVLLLACFAWGTHVRNQVWSNEATLWRDVTVKSPSNGRGLMNYGLSLMNAGDYPRALEYFNRALVFTPNYYVLEINLGIVHGQLNHDAEAERCFQRAILLAPLESQPYHYYARWLHMRGREQDALMNAQKAIGLNPLFLESQSLRQQILAAAQRPEADLAQLERVVAAAPTPEKYLDLSFRYHQARRYADCIRTAQEAIKRKPDLAEAYNNIAAAHEELGEWDAAILAAGKAVQLKPDFTLARNNLAWSISQRNKR